MTHIGKGWNVLHSAVSPFSFQLPFATPRVALSVKQIKHGLPYSVTCPSISTDPGSLTQWWDPGIHMQTGAGGTVWANHTWTLLYQRFLNCFDTYCAAIGDLCQREVVSSSCKRRPVIRSTIHNPLPLQLTVTRHCSMWSRPLYLVHSPTYI